MSEVSEVRKLAPILDLAGYSRLTGAGEDGFGRDIALPVATEAAGYPPTCDVRARDLQRQRYVDSGRPLRATSGHWSGRGVLVPLQRREERARLFEFCSIPMLAKVQWRSPGFAGVGASVMLPCQEGESPSDVKS